jgi:uncharacterized membrane protein YtjA (UPF0391 family)
VVPCMVDDSAEAYKRQRIVNLGLFKFSVKRNTIQFLRSELSRPLDQGGLMLRWALAFFIIAIIAAVFGFTGIAVASAGIAKILFVVFLVLFLLSLIGHLFRRV